MEKTSFVYLPSSAHQPVRIPPDEFLRILNTGYPDSPLIEPHTYAFTQSVDAIIIGPCSIPLRFMTGRSINAVTSAITSPIVEMNLGGTVLLIPSCCGQYPRWFQDMLVQTFPDIAWVMLNTEDYCGKVHSEKVADVLLYKGFISESRA